MGDHKDRTRQPPKQTYFDLRGTSMNDQTRTNFDETGLDETERTGAFVGDTLSKQDAAASSGDPVDTPMPVFLEDVDPEQIDIPAFITTTSARELFGVQPGESIKDALVRLAREHQEE